MNRPASIPADDRQSYCWASPRRCAGGHGRRHADLSQRFCSGDDRVRAGGRRHPTAFGVDSASRSHVFKLELPPGRYTFFAEPSQAGAPATVRRLHAVGAGAQTHAAQEPCEDHALVVVDLGSADTAVAACDRVRSSATGPSRTTLADELDHLLGNRTNPSVQELGAPRFSEYPAAHPEACRRRHALDFYGQHVVNASMQAHAREADALRLRISRARWPW